jgi:hypothetical protein
MALLIGILGWVGSAAVVLAYALISTDRVQGSSVFYHSLNLVGSICLIVNTGYHAAYPSTFVNGVWTVIALFALVRSGLQAAKIRRTVIE